YSGPEQWVREKWAMRLHAALRIAIGVCLFTAAAQIDELNQAKADSPRVLKVHLAQANNDSPYALVRAKFEPGELNDAWAVRFFDEKGTEIPYFVWDSVTWQVARNGRDDWGHRYALINHAPGDAPDALEGRAKKIEWAKQNIPEVGV